MKLQQIGLWVLVFGSVCVISTALQRESGVQQCSRGPSHWCENLRNAKKCNAVRHCIQTVWENQDVPEDTDSICEICLKMVKEARDQLESNQTQSDLRDVFEGSCRLIPVKPIQKECIKVADDFIPELVEALASQMNPQVVCSVAGLCNNAKIDKMLKNYKEITTTPAPAESSTLALPVTTARPENYKRRELSCNECGSVADIISTKFKMVNRDDMLESVLSLCGHASSFSDACANIALTYFNNLYNHFEEHFSADAICHLSGTCSAKFHQHPEKVEVLPRSDNGFVPLKKDDIPCELCQQLIHHLQEVLTANTTEIEFKMVLEGLCRETKGFKTECLSIVDQYYEQIYNALTHNLDANGICFMIGVCPKGSGNFFGRRDMIPLIPYVEPAKVTVKITKLTQNEPIYSKEQIDSMQLPIDFLMGAKNPELLVENGELCILCEYFLHFLQETLATPATEDKIKEAVEQVCSKFPTSLRGNCHNFVDMYGDAVIALVIQGFDPRQVCPKLTMCPKNSKDADVDVFASQPIDVSINVHNDQSDKPTCPLCLFAVKQAQEMIRDNKSKSNIKYVLDNLCTHLPSKLKDECVDFVETYSNELVDMLITDFTPQQICVYIKLCTPDSSGKPELDDFETDTIDDYSIESLDLNEKQENFEATALPQCLLCEKVITEAEKKLGPKKTKAEIKNALNHACDKLHKIKDKCHKFVDKYGDKISDLLLLEMAPKQICRELGYCSSHSGDSISDEIMDQISMETEKDEITNIPDDISNENNAQDPPPCVLCEFIVSKLEAELKDKKTEEEIKREVEVICKKMPKTVATSCDQFVAKYADLIIALLETLPPKQICQKLQLCQALDTKVTDQVIQCGVCHGATSSLIPYIHEQKPMTADPQGLIEVACDNLPAKYYKKCSELLEYYGESIFNMIKLNTKQSDICANIGKCFEEESSSLAYVRISETVDRVRRNDVLVGANKCTYGPSHWCASKENAKSCGSTEFCEKKVWKNSPV